MKEVKFRLWLLDEDRMIHMDNKEDEFSLCGGQPSLSLKCTYRDYSDNEDFVLMQYTGLKDKNGKEIYEGDLVEWSCETEICSSPRSEISIVEFRKGSFFPVASPTHTCYYSVEDPVCEVIGNIYENPELMPK